MTLREISIENFMFNMNLLLKKNEETKDKTTCNQVSLDSLSEFLYA